MPGGGPPPPPIIGGPPPPLMMGGKAIVQTSPFHDPKRKKMVQWRWNPIPAMKLNKTIFKDVKPLNVDVSKFGGMLEDTLSKKEIVRGTPRNDDGTPRDGSSSARSKKDEDAPKVLDRSRCTVIEIIKKRFAEPASFIAKAIRNVDTSYLTTDKLQELMGLFPAKSFDMERKMLLEDYKGEVSELSQAEQFLHALMSVPNVRQRITMLTFALEVPEKLNEYEDTLQMVQQAFGDLDNPKVLRTLEYCVAIGNYINNSTKLISGFKVSNLLKMSDVRSQESKGVTLLHTLARIVEQEEPELLSLVDELESFTLAPSALEACSGAANNLAAGLRQLQSARKTVKDDEKVYCEFLDETIGKVQETVEGHDAAMKECLQKVEFYGEQAKTIDDAVVFLENWRKFLAQYRTAIKFNIAHDKKAKAREEKEKKEIERKEAKAARSKLASSIRNSSKDLKKNINQDQKLEGFFAGPRKRREIKIEDDDLDEADIDMIVDDLVGSNALAAAEEVADVSAGEKEADGAAEEAKKKKKKKPKRAMKTTAVYATLKRSNTFLALRESRKKGGGKEEEEEEEEILREVDSAKPRLSKLSQSMEVSRDDRAEEDSPRRDKKSKKSKKDKGTTRKKKKSDEKVRNTLRKQKTVSKKSGDGLSRVAAAMTFRDRATLRKKQTTRESGGGGARPNVMDMWKSSS
eukprot:TRINITY_DN4687_c1_g1_i1.p1 TRINITY_DN4687_c1_g1~~TRINITY_DN4687_c1_g1_i1.p1  ORF type:complete len:688 (-),score=294.28 TRINITY_DN4687_c1_g1_i1:262-2325(-)